MSIEDAVEFELRPWGADERLVEVLGEQGAAEFRALLRNRRQMLIPEIAVEYANLVDESVGRVHARVTVAQETSAEENNVIARELSRALGKEVVPHMSVNPAILGGVVVRIGDTVMDGSVRRRLAALRRKMLA